MHLGVRDAELKGFTLLELVLAIVLLMLLSGAIVFSFTNLQKRTHLDEGVNRLITVVRYAKAHAATSGRPMQFQLVQGTNDALNDTRIRVLWEPDPANKPGELADLREVLSMVEAVNDLVQCQPTDPPSPNAEMETADDTVLKRLALHPDGSAEPGQLIVTSRDGEDDRRFLFEIIGITGELKKRELNTNEFTETLEATLP
ncbi:MAG: pilus assembly FimT family protein [Limisphaerales bacterium]